MSGPFIKTFTGRRFYVLNPRPEDIDIWDIAHALSNIGRFTGHAKRFISVAEHSLRVASMVPAEHKLQALLHDASEAYYGDVSTPCKHTDAFTEYRALEAKAQAMIYTKYDCAVDEHQLVKEADGASLGLEAMALMGVQWGEGWDRYLDLARLYYGTSLASAINEVRWLRRSPEHYEEQFLATFDELNMGVAA